MLVAEIIKPNKVKEWNERGFVESPDFIYCDDCKMDYSVKDYQTLMDAKKLGYFFFTDPTNMGLYLLCHGCLFKKIKKISNDEIVDLIIMDESYEYTCRFYPEDGEPDGPMFESDGEKLPPFLPED